LSKVQVDTIDTRSGTSTMQIGSTNTSTINIVFQVIQSTSRQG